MLEKTNSFDLMREGIQNGLLDSEIIDVLQEQYPTSRIENNIFILEETKLILETPPKPIPIKTKISHFLIKNDKNFVDIRDGRMFKPYNEKTYSQCKEGLCKKLNTLVLKNVIKKSHNPSVFVAIENKPKENKAIRIKYKNDNKKEQVWEFTSQEINECEKCINEGKNDRQIAVALFCPKICVQKLIKHIDINQKLSRSRNGDLHGNNKNKNNKHMGKRQTNRKTRREN